MTRRRALSLTAGLALAVGCRAIYALHPLFTEAELLSEPALLGVWAPREAPQGDHWVFLGPDSSSHSYFLAVADSVTAAALPGVNFDAYNAGDSATRAMLRRNPAARAQRARDSLIVQRLLGGSEGPRLFVASLGRLAGILFLDMTALSIGESRVGRNLLLPVHWFWRVAVEGDRLTLTPLSNDWLEAMIDSGRVDLAHVVGDDSSLVLTAPTSELQRLVTRYAQDSAAFRRSDAREFQRPPPARRRAPSN